MKTFRDKTRFAIMAVALLALSGTPAFSQTRQDHNQFDQHDQQVTQDWYKQNQAHPPAGLRDRDKLSADEESRLREGAALDPDLRNKVHPAPRDLTRRLPAPPKNNRYVTIGGHVGQIDNNFQLKAVIHLHDNH